MRTPCKWMPVQDLPTKMLINTYFKLRPKYSFFGVARENSMDIGAQEATNAWGLRVKHN